MKSINIGFVSTRFAGIDGVSLEANKWAEVFMQNGHDCFWFAGKLDRDPEKSFLVPEAYFHQKKRKIPFCYRINSCLEITFENPAP
jgi:hypothetical protein